MKDLFLALLLLLGATNLTLSSPQTPWSAGVIVTTNDQVLQGEIRYNYAHDIVMYRETADANLQTFSTKHIASFRYYDEGQKRVRYFRNYTYHESEYLIRPAFFEVVVLGDISYLRKHNQSTYFDATNPRRFAVRNSGRTNPHVSCYNYYVYIDGEIIRSRRFKQEVLPRLLDQGIAVKSYMKERGLQSGFVDDQIRLIQYANQQLQQFRLSASAQ